MRSRFQEFDRSRLRVKPLAERRNDLQQGWWLQANDPTPAFEHADLAVVAQRLAGARAAGACRILMAGGHLLRAGVNRQLIELMRGGWIDHIAMNGSVAIHDYELARIGATTESVARYIRTGEFGLWRETGELNEWVAEAARAGLGCGENIGRRISESSYAARELSILGAAYELSIPATVHVGIGYDIVHEHSNCDGAAWGQTSYRDFLVFTHSMERLEGGVVLSFGSAVMGPEVYLKALAMVRNVAGQENRTLTKFTTAVFDICPIRGDYHCELDKTDPGYYFRPHKTLLVRTVADGGNSYYFEGQHRATLPALLRSVRPYDRSRNSREVSRADGADSGRHLPGSVVQL